VHGGVNGGEVRGREHSKVLEVVDKSGDAFSKTGDTVTYTVTVKETGDTALELGSITDSIDVRRSSA
jgi:uncharacterized repeat protein (TIGR01451 family)